jgi:hypothetical protein
MAKLCSGLSSFVSQQLNHVRDRKSKSHKNQKQPYKELKTANQEREDFLCRNSAVIVRPTPEGMFDSHAPPPPSEAAAKGLDGMGSLITYTPTSGDRHTAKESRDRGRDGIIRQSIGLREDERIEARDMATS